MVLLGRCHHEAPRSPAMAGGGIPAKANKGRGKMDAMINMTGGNQ